MWAAGNNWVGPLGAVLSDIPVSSTPAQVVIDDVVTVSCAIGHVLFLKNDGTAWAMGDNGYGQLGDGTVQRRARPVLVMSGVAAISAGSRHSLFLKNDGTVWASGYADVGQLGDGALPTASYRATPVQVMSDVAAICAGEGHSLFLKTDGTAWSTGWGWAGELGNGQLGTVRTPVQVLQDVAAISAGTYHSLFLKRDGAVWATGANNFGQFGDGSLMDQEAPVLAMSGVSAISAGRDYSIFLKTDGSAWASGLNDSGQLGDGTLISRAAAVRIMDGIMAIASGESHSLLLGVDGSAWAVGRNDRGQLGDGTIIDRRAPVRVIYPTSRENLASFQLQHFSAMELTDLTVSGSGADPDGDGMGNYFEYALGLDPRRSDSSGAFQFSGSNGQLSLRYRRLRSDVYYQVEGTSRVDEPSSWSVTNVIQGEPDLDDWVTASMPITQPACFLRLRVSIGH